MRGVKAGTIPKYRQHGFTSQRAFYNRCLVITASHVPTRQKGAYSELKACAWLIGKGYDVFRNVSQHGRVDIIAKNFDTGEMVLVEVKTAMRNLSTGKLHVAALRPDQRAVGLRVLAVADDWIGWLEDWEHVKDKTSAPFFVAGERE